MDVLSGAREAERTQRLGFASIVAVVMSACGTPTDPRAVIGEQVEFGESPFGTSGPSAEEQRSMHETMRRRVLEDAHREWMPKRLAEELGVNDDDDHDPR